jgi:aspartate/methionine/tyrosine aminotransferase
MDTLMINSSSCVAGFTQMAAIEAFDAPDSEASVERMRREFERRRDLLVDGLNAIPGFRCAKPQGAFYVFPNIEGTGMGERELARGLLEDAGVAVLPGTAFGDAGRGFLRLAYTNSTDKIEAALDRIGAYLKQHSTIH